VAVDAAGRVGTSAFVLEQGLVRVEFFVSDPETLRFSTPLRITPAPFDPAAGGLAGKHGVWWIGDYQGLTSTGETFHLLWSDTRSGQLELFTATITPGRTSD
jgi:hypothetical protein